MAVHRSAGNLIAEINSKLTPDVHDIVYLYAVETAFVEQSCVAIERGDYKWFRNIDRLYRNEAYPPMETIRDGQKHRAQLEELLRCACNHGRGDVIRWLILKRGCWIPEVGSPEKIILQQSLCGDNPETRFYIIECIMAREKDMFPGYMFDFDGDFERVVRLGFAKTIMAYIMTKEHLLSKPNCTELKPFFRDDHVRNASLSSIKQIAFRCRLEREFPAYIKSLRKLSFRDATKLTRKTVPRMFVVNWLETLLEISTESPRLIRWLPIGNLRAGRNSDIVRALCQSSLSKLVANLGKNNLETGLDTEGGNLAVLHENIIIDSKKVARVIRFGSEQFENARNDKTVESKKEKSHADELPKAEVVVVRKGVWCVPRVTPSQEPPLEGFPDLPTQKNMQSPPGGPGWV